MKYYQLNAETFERQKWRILWVTLPPVLMAIGVGLWISQSDQPASSWPTLLTTLAIALVIVPIGLWRGIQMQREAWCSFRLGLDDGQIAREQTRTARVEIAKQDVESLTETSHGLVVKGGESFIVVPAALEDYALIRETLQDWGPIETRDAKTKQAVVIQYIVALSVVASFAAVMVLENRYAVTLIGLALTAAIIVSFISMQRSQHLDRKLKRSSLLIVFPLLAILAKVLFVWLD